MDIHFRPRRLRQNPILRRMVRETRLGVDQLIHPLFVSEGRGVREEISSMPGQYRLSPDTLLGELEQLRDLSIPAVMLFGVVGESSKDAVGSAAYAPQGVICQALEAARKEVPEVLRIADVCLCQYTNHGHCGLLRETAGGETIIDNDETVTLLAKTALAYARAGADVVAPSDMMDGRVAAIRRLLDQEQLQQIPILSYAAKYASAFYGPFREAAGSSPRFGDRRTHQMDPANAREALKEVELDLQEGADMVMVKPALPCLDVIFQVRQRTRVPVAAYQVSGEYAALCAAFHRGWLERRATIRESLLAIRRAGADLILTYFAKEAARLMAEGDF